MKNENICSIKGDHQQAQETRLKRWQRLRTVQTLLPDERVAFCMRRLQASNVSVYYNPTHQSAHYQGLMACGSVWVCPLCSVRITERRRIELEQAITACIAQGGVVYLATYTVSHQEYDTLSELLRSFLAARKRAKQGRRSQQLQQQFGIIGTISVREVTWSQRNGWHPHCHELIFFAREIDAETYAQAMHQQWRTSAEHEGLSMNDHGFQLDRTYGAVADYIAKFGREPRKEPWGPGAELTKAHLKRGRGEEHLTPFAMLERIAQGEEELIPRFHEYAQCFKGKRQLVWSPGLRKHLFARNEEETDSEIAQQEDNEEFVILGQITPRQWSIVLLHDARGKLLEVARTGNWQQVCKFVQALCINSKSQALLLGRTTDSVSTA